MKMRLVSGLVLGVMLLMLLASCTPPAAPALSIDGAWGKPSPMYPTTGGVYMLIKNTGSAPDKLLSGTSPACGSIEIHDTVMKADGTSMMILLDKPLEITPSGQAELKPGGLHIMCIMKKDDQFKVGAQVELTLKFEKSGEKKVMVEVRAQ